MKLRDAAIQLTLDDWIGAIAPQFGAHVRHYPSTTYWYGRSIFICIVHGGWPGVSFNAWDTGICLPSFWPDQHKLSVVHLQKLDADIAIAPREEITSIFLAFQKEVQ